MNIKEKQDRVKELSKIEFLSDQEIEEKERLLEEITQELNEFAPNVISSNPIEITKPEKKYRGVISGRIIKYLDERKERNKATPEKIRQLELEARKAELEARISMAKAKKRGAKGGRFNIPRIPDKIFTESGKKEYQRTKSKISSNDKDYSALF